MKLSTFLGRRAIWILVAIAATLLLLRACAPACIERLVEARMNDRADLHGDVGDVEISLWNPSIVVRDLHAASSPSADHDLTITVPQIRVFTTWHDLLTGDTRFDVVLSHPVVRIEELGETEPRSEPLTLKGIRSLGIEDGELTAVLRPFGSQDVELALESIDLRVRETAARASRTMTGIFELDAEVTSGGSMHADGGLSFADPVGKWTAELAVAHLEIPPFNPVLRTLLGVDAERGRLSLTGRLASASQISGSITPSFEDLALYGAQERSRRPMTEAIFSEMLTGANGTIPIQRRKPSEGTRSAAPLEIERVEGLMRDMIRRGFDRRLDDLDGFSATVGSLEIDLEAGLLMFGDITIVKDHTTLSYPFFHTDQMLVRIDQSVVHGDGDGLPPLKEVTLTRPTLTFVQGPTDATRQMKFDPQWPEKVSALPYPTETLHVIDGRVELWHLEPTAASVYLTDLNVDVAHMYSAKFEDQRQATFEVSANVMGDAPLHVSGSYRPGARLPDLELELNLEKFELARLNPLARALLRVDISAGTAKVWGRLDTADGKMLAQVEPEFRGIEMIGAHERSIERPLAEFLIGIGLTKRASRPIEVEYTSDSPMTDLPRKVGRALISK